MELININKNEQLENFTGACWGLLDLSLLKNNTHRARLFFTDLETWGVFLVWFCFKHGIQITNTTVYKHVFYAIYINNVVIKCFVRLGCTASLSTQPKEIVQYLLQLNTFCLAYLKKDLYNFKINSLASLANHFLALNPTNMFSQLSPDKQDFIKRAFAGGRCELYAPGMHKYVASFDFPSMYGNILKTSFPSDFS
jgi:hypothetical protein